MKANPTFFWAQLCMFLFFSVNAQLTTNLPIIVINTYGNPIPDDPKITADMGIIYNGVGVTNNSWDPYNNYNGKIGIEQRGSSSAWFPQKSYGFETRTAEGLNLDVSLLGLPAENDWVLHAPYTDKSLLRNVLAYNIWNQMGHYGPRTRFVELILNGNYQGVYVLTENVKRGNNRVDISKLLPTDISGDNLTGGYIIKIDKTTGGGSGWTSPYLSPAPASKQISLLYHYPESDEIVIQQSTYIQNFYNAMENTLAGANFAHPTVGYRNFMSIASFIDYLILNEISKNVDGYRISTFMNKDKSSKGGKLKAGPAWDYNIAWYNADYCAGDEVAGWAYNFPTTCPDDDYQVPFWWSRMMEDPYFVNRTRCRYEELRTNILLTSNLHTYIDRYATDTLAAAQVRHFNRWPILGTYVWPNPATPPTYSSGGNSEIGNLKTWLTNRLNWMDANLPGNCALLPVNLISFTGKRLANQNVELHWTTASEFQLNEFVIEYSLDGSSFSEAGRVSGRNKNTHENYQWEIPISQNANFRLKMINEDSSEEYSEIIQVDGIASIMDDFELFPNPATSYTDFAFRVNSSTDVSIELLDSKGIVVQSSDLVKLAEGRYVHRLENLESLPSGAYLVKVQSEKTILYKKLIK